MDLKNHILSVADSPLEKIAVPEWDCAFYLRNMTGTERDSWELASFRDGKISPEHFRAKLLVRCIADEQGKRVFTDEDAAALSGKSSQVLLRLYDVAARLNGIGVKAVDDLAKN